MEMVFHLCFMHIVYATIVYNDLMGEIISVLAIWNMPAVEDVELDFNGDNFVYVDLISSFGWYFIS